MESRIQNPGTEFWNPWCKIKNPPHGIQHPKMSWITLLKTICEAYCSSFVNNYLNLVWGHPQCKTCEVFLYFLALIILGSIVLTSYWLLFINYLTSLMRFSGFYTEYEPCWPTKLSLVSISVLSPSKEQCGVDWGESFKAF